MHKDAFERLIKKTTADRSVNLISLEAGVEEHTLITACVDRALEYLAPLSELNFYGGTVWYDDGTWAEYVEVRGYDIWVFRQCPEMPPGAPYPTS